MGRRLPSVYPAFTAVGAVVTGDFTTAAILVSIVMSPGAGALERTTAGLVVAAIQSFETALAVDPEFEAARANLEKAKAIREK
ncbi:MAG: hypothetical protein QGF67_01940 [Lentisphaeria bacterium]|jgi:hypothetical protein|nr:hypothetical protein [Lentisphaeria bacterium]MDP7740173.1 hypothetical protein [Lentisphaeria bacterium]